MLVKLIANDSMKCHREDQDMHEFDLTESRHFQLKEFLLFLRCCKGKLPPGEICVGPGIPEIGGAMCASGSCVERFPWWVMLIYPPSAISKPDFLYSFMLIL